MSRNEEALIYTRIAAELLKKLNTIDNEALTGEDTTINKLSVIVEAFQGVDSIAEDRYKKSNGTQVQHLPEDSGAVN